MRRATAALILLVFTLPAQSYTGGPDSIYRPGVGYVERGSETKVSKAQKAKPKKTVIAGKVFERNPETVSYHSDAAPWVAELRRYKGMNARQIGLSRTTLWCGTILGERTSLPKPKNPHWAADWAQIGTRISSPKPGAIALVSNGRRGRGIDHVAVVTGIDANGNPILISGNNGGIVREHSYPASRVVAYIWPNA